MPDALTQRTLEIVASHLDGPAPDLAVTTTFQELDLDSFDVVNIVADLEQEYDVFVPNDDALAITTIGDAVAELRKLIEQKQANGTT